MTPEVKAQLEEAKKNCIFCKLIQGEHNAKIVFKDKICTGILDINQVVKGHVLLAPNEHYPIMPYLPQNEFEHIFGLMPKLMDALKKAMLCTGSSILIANGGIAGQRAPHFLIHLMPRENGDGANKFALNQEIALDDTKMKETYNLLANNIPLMMQNHFKRTNQEYNKGELPEFLQKKQILYEDHLCIVCIPEKPQCAGHLVIYSKEEEKLIENLSKESSAHLFYVSSFCATAVFEGMQAQGSNIILKSGLSDDNPDEKLIIHILPRFENDGIDIENMPLKNKPNLDEIQSKIKDKTFVIEHTEEKDEPLVIDMDQKTEIISDNKPKDYSDPKDEILDAIKQIQR